MERKEGKVKVEFSRFLWAVMAVLLCAAPIFAYYIAYGEDDIYEDTPSISDGLLAMPGSNVNIYSGAIGDGTNTGITVSTGASVTVHGTGFADSSGPISTTEWTPSGGSDTLTGTYANGTPISLLFNSDTQINLVDTGGGDPIELIQQLIARVESFNFHQGIDNSLDAKLDAALNALDDVNANNDVAAINTLQAFINAVEAQRDNKITSAQADILIADAQAIIDLLNAQ